MTAGIPSSSSPAGREPARDRSDDGARPALPRGSPGPPAEGAGPSGPAPASRVSVLAPRTRIDVALPPDVPIAELLPTLVDLAGESGDGEDGAGDDPRDGRAVRGGWTLAPLGQGPAEPDRTLAALGVLDGDQLVLRRRADAAPPPLFDDVVDAVAEATPGSFRPWGAALAHRTGLAGLGVGLALAAVALAAAGRGPGTAGGLVTALVAGVAAAGCVAVGAACAGPFGRPATGTVLAVGGCALALVCGVTAVPGPEGALAVAAPHLMLGAVLATVTAAASLLLLGTASRSGLAALVAVVGAALLLALTAGVATLTGAGGASAAAGEGADPAAAAAGAGAAALVVASLLPRVSVALARLPLPRIPGSAEELAEDPGVADREDVERRTDRAHAAMTGLLLACGVVSAGAVAVLAAHPPGGVRGVFAWVLGALLTLLVALRSRTYANAAQALSLLVCTLVAAVALVTGVIAATAPGVAAVAPAAGALVLGAVAVLLGTVLPGRRFSPVARRAVDIGEAVGIAAVLPVALAVMDLYTAVRLW